MIGSPASVSPKWTRPAVDRGRFQQEQSALAHVWTFLGLTTDLKRDGDWFTASLASRSVFVQRIGSEIRGFENVCAHRHYPLRDSERGNGPIVCPYHHWRYDGQGRAVGIPKCEELFGFRPSKLGARLEPVDIATCGSLIFGRFPRASNDCSLEGYLGLAFPILDSMSPKEYCPRYMTESVDANWRFCFDITLDDYHAVAVHPTTLGKHGYVRRDQISYARFGHHSAYVYDADPHALEKMAKACCEGRYEPYTYSILHIFPNLLVVHVVADADHWRCSIQQYVPVTPCRSTFRAWSYPAPSTAGQPWLRRLGDHVTEPIRARIFQYFVRRVAREDLRICENLQKVADQAVSAPRIGRLEERIEWFEEAYRSICVAEAVHEEMDRVDAQ